MGKGKLSVVVGGQYGSEGKGAVAGHLSSSAWNDRLVACMRVAGPNAGHTVIGYGPDGQDNYPWRLRSVPVAAVSNPSAMLLVAAGSEVDLSVLDSEIEALDRAGYDVTNRLVVDHEATLLEPRHIEAEATAGLNKRLGSTGKGIGAARADRLMRTARRYSDARSDSGDTVFAARSILDAGGHVIIEGTQGYGLGLRAGHYPKCTSSDCRAIDFLAMAGLSPWEIGVGQFDVWVVARTLPIRVAGDSGPMKGETTWEQLALEPELTTVTQKVRRVGEWDPDLVAGAVEANGGAPTVRLAVTMVDYLFKDLENVGGSLERAREDDPLLDKWLNSIEDQVHAPVLMTGTGPSTVLTSMEAV